MVKNEWSKFSNIADAVAELMNTTRDARALLDGRSDVVKEARSAVVYEAEQETLLVDADFRGHLIRAETSKGDDGETITKHLRDEPRLDEQKQKGSTAKTALAKAIQRDKEASKLWRGVAHEQEVVLGYLNQLAAGSDLSPVTRPAVKIQPGVPPVQAAAEIFRKIELRRGDARKIVAAPMTEEEVLALIALKVGDVAMDATPDISPMFNRRRHGIRSGTIDWPRGDFFPADRSEAPFDYGKAVFWLLRDEMTTALQAKAAAMALDFDDPLTTLERDERLLVVRADLWDLGQQAEALVREARATGQQLLRPTPLDPRIILGISPKLPRLEPREGYEFSEPTTWGDEDEVEATTDE